MKLDSKTAVIVLAAGSGKRMNAGQNKMFLQLNGKPVLERTVTVFQQSDAIDGIVIVAKADEVEQVQKMVPKEQFGKIICYTAGGKERQDSVLCGLTALKTFGEDVYHRVLIHDGARPFINQETIKKTIERVKEVGAVVVGAPAIDTIKICSEKGEIIETPKRKTVFHAQTPQTFRFDEILKAHEKLKGENFTDDSSMMEKLGHKVYIVEATHENRKITFREDLQG